MRLVHDTPVVLGFASLSFIALGIDLTTDMWLSFSFLMCPGTFEPLQPSFWTGLILHIFGHAGINHYIGNFSLILVLGPTLERRYGSYPLALMIFLTAIITGITNVMFFDTMVFGASGISFMMVSLLSMMDAQEGEVRITTLLALILWIGSEILASLRPDDIAHYAHIVGGLCGAFFGLYLSNKINHWSHK